MTPRSRYPAAKARRRARTLNGRRKVWRIVPYGPRDPSTPPRGRPREGGLPTSDGLQGSVLPAAVASPQDSALPLVSSRLERSAPMGTTGPRKGTGAREQVSNADNRAPLAMPAADQGFKSAAANRVAIHADQSANLQGIWPDAGPAGAVLRRPLVALLRPSRPPSRASAKALRARRKPPRAPNGEPVRAKRTSA
jgi:hypothetical protein